MSEYLLNQYRKAIQGPTYSDLFIGIFLGIVKWIGIGACLAIGWRMFE